MSWKSRCIWMIRSCPLSQLLLVAPLLSLLLIRVLRSTLAVFQKVSSFIFMIRGLLADGVQPPFFTLLSAFAWVHNCWVLIRFKCGESIINADQRQLNTAVTPVIESKTCHLAFIDLVSMLLRQAGVQGQRPWSGSWGGRSLPKDFLCVVHGKWCDMWEKWTVRLELPPTTLCPLEADTTHKMK